MAVKRHPSIGEMEGLKKVEVADIVEWKNVGVLIRVFVGG